MGVCKHIEQVFQNEKTKDGVLKAYNNAKKVISHASYKDRLLYTMKCSKCHEINAGSNFMCLQCEFSGCWNHSHFTAHSNEVGHIFGVSASNGLLFCFKCIDYIGDIELLLNSNLTDDWDKIDKETHVPDEMRRDGLYGIVNMGATCFMSSILQSLMHNPYIVNYSMSQDHYQHCELKDPTSCMSCALDSIISESYGSISDKNDHNGFLSFLNCAWKINQNFAGYSQQDAHEFLQFILNRLHYDYKLISSRLNAPNSDSHGNCHCISHSIFKGTLKSSIVCPECNDDSKTILDPYMDLSLDIKGKQTLYECLDSFHRKEQLHDFNYHCPQCKTSQDPIKQLTISKLAPVMVFQLKRFEHLMNGNNVKINDFVSFPTYLNMKSYYVDDKQNMSDSPDIIYELIGIISHKGTVNEGHYIATLKLPSGDWFRFNDSMVSFITEEEALREQAYLLFFTVKQVN